ncbi:MAG: TonB-dependent receptor [Sulfuricurvum sp.]|nr:TonB-dependent receptor [Sulfuricurvum sp.]
MQKHLLILSFAAVTALYSADGVFDLGKVDVTDNAEKSASTTTIIDLQEIQDKERKTLVDSLLLLPGISLQNGAGRNEQMVMMRGFDVKHAPLFIDGIPIAVPYDGYVDFSRFTTFDLSEIEVSKGFASVLMGPNTFAGAINMVTRRPSKSFEGDMGAGLFSGSGKTGYMNLGSNQGNYYVQASLSKTMRDSFPLSHDFPSGIKYEDGSSRDNAYASDSKINLKVGFTPNSTDEYAINYIKQTADKGVPPYAGIIDGTLIKDSNPNNSGGGYVHFWKWNYWDKESLYFLSKTDFGNWYIKSRLYYDKFKNSLSMYTNNTYTTLSPGSNATNPSINPSWYDDDTKGASLETGIKLSNADTLKGSLHYKIDTHQEGGYYGESVPAKSIVVGTPAPTYTMQNNTKSAALEETHIFSDTFKLVTGVSYDILSTNSANNTNPTDPTYGAEFPHTSTNALNPQASLYYTPSSSTIAHISIAKKSRFPSIKDLYSYRMGQAIPNPDLNPERAINYEIGINQLLSSTLSGTINLFHASVNDYIQQNWISTTTYQLQNIGKITQNGAEFSLVYAPIDTLSLEGSYTRLLMKNDSNPAVPIVQVPANRALLSASYSPIASIKWINTLEYNSGFTDSLNSAYVHLSGYAKYNTKIIYDATHNLSFDVGMNNALDRNYYLTYGYPDAGRVFFGNVRYKF